MTAAKRPQLTLLTIEPYSGCDLAALAQAKSLLHTLRHLTLKGGHASIEEVFALVQSPGQALDSLCVECRVTAPVQAEPTVDSWPRDTRLHVAVPLAPLVLKSLAAGHWPIDALEVSVSVRDLAGIAAGFQELAHLRLSNMKSFSCVVFGWSNLQAILTTVCLGITQASWPALQSFKLKSPCVSDVHLGLLACGRWPMLESFHVSGGLIRLQGTVQLAKSRWPLLRSVMLPIEAVGAEFQCHAQATYQALFAMWPALTVCSSRTFQLQRSAR